MVRSDQRYEPVKVSRLNALYSRPMYTVIRYGHLLSTRQPSPVSELLMYGHSNDYRIPFNYDEIVHGVYIKEENKKIASIIDRTMRNY